ncbi:aminoglycoside phosphotransferase [Kordiimonas sediminis]|uniref:Aminoglycoside phosphotransferase n=2 Tax=Kordiimonas sediminis TaxID=1735581 RepID=A0A919E9R1_9PROT|nr:phosphotransferase family protein [Kordiimonas sediminis]GHF26733.1 aminoglycoside phosphotransferase [Kordiimonas sediminis]
MSDELNKTIDVRSGEELDVGLIDDLMKSHISGLTGDPEIRQFASGHSNLTYAIQYGSKRFVLRRPPFGTKPKSGHSMIREYKVMNGLKDAFSAVPDTYFYLSDEDSPLGAECYVMELVDGYKPEKTMPPSLQFSASDNRTLCENFFSKLIELHAVDYKAAGLGDFGKPEGYVERQITGWNGRFERARTDDVEDFQDVRDWLVEKMPETEVGHSVLHGDYRLDNVILCKSNPHEIAAVLDWEISALGDPLMDLGNTLAYWTQKGDPEFLLNTTMQPCLDDGMMTREEICDFYAEKTGLDLSKFSYYHVYGIFRNAAILQQIYYRYYHGQSQNKAFAGFGAFVNVLGNHARDLINKSDI